MRRLVFGLISFVVLLAAAACTVQVTVNTPGVAGESTIPNPPTPYPTVTTVAPISVTQTITMEKLITVTQPQPLWMVDVLPAAALSSTYALTPTLLSGGPKFYTICKLEQLQQVAVSEMATPLLALGHKISATLPVTVETFLTPPVGRTVYRIDPTLPEGGGCVPDQTWLWLEAHYTPTVGMEPDAVANAARMFSLPAMTACTLPNGVEIANLVNLAKERNDWIDFIAVKEPDGTISLVRLTRIPLDQCPDSGGGSGPQREFCSRLDCSTLYGQVVCYVVGC